MQPLTTTESLLIHGANGVAGRSSAHFTWVAAGLLALLLSTRLISMTRLSNRIRCSALGLTLVFAAIPGLVHVLWLRGDAPLLRPHTAQTIHSTLDALQRLAPWPEPIAVTHEDDDVMFPLARYAVPTRSPAHGDARQLETYGATLLQGCRTEGLKTICRPLAAVGSQTP